MNDDEAGTSPAWVNEFRTPGQSIIFCEPRGMGATTWTTKNPPHLIARSHVLLGRTVDSGRLWDVLAAAKYLRGHGSTTNVAIAGKGPAGALAAYAAILDSDIVGVTLLAPPTTHMDVTAPQFLNVLRVCDIPAALGLIAPRPLTITGIPADKFSLTAKVYGDSQAKERLTIK